MRRAQRRLAAFAVGIALAAAFTAVAFDGRPQPVGADAQPGRFSAARAHRFLAQHAVLPRPVGSDAHRAMGDAIGEEIRRLGLRVTEQRGISAHGRFRSFVTAAPVRNIMTRVPGSMRSGTMLVMAHYDSVPTSPGASDDGYGTAALLEALRALMSQGGPRRDTIFLWTDGEERGLLGAHYFADQHLWAKEVEFVINVEARGNAGPAIVFETGPRSDGFLTGLVRSYPRLSAWSLAAAAYRRMPNDTDFSVFREKGIRGINIANIRGLTQYHSMLDSTANADLRTLQHHGDTLMAAMSLALGSEKPWGVQGDFWPTTVFMIPRWGAVAIPPITMVLICGIQLLLGVAFLRVAGRTGHFRRREVLLMVGRFAAGVGMGAAVSGLLRLLLPVLDGDLSSFPMGEGYAPGSSYYRAFFALAAIASLTALVRNAVAESRGLLLVGATIAGGAALATVCAAILPEAAYLFSIPGVALGAAGCCLLSSSSGVRGVGLGLQLVAIALSGLLFAPVVVLLFEALTLRLVVVPALVTGLGMLVCLPLVTPLLGRRGGLISLMFALGLLLVLGRWSSPTGEERPIPAAFLHAQELGGPAHWISCLPPRDTWSRATMAGATQEDAGRYLPSVSRCPYTTGRFFLKPAPLLPQKPLRLAVARTSGGLLLHIGGIPASDTLYVFLRPTHRPPRPGHPSREATPRFLELNRALVPEPSEIKLGYAAIGRLLGMGRWITAVVAAPRTETTVLLDSDHAATLIMVVAVQSNGLPSSVPERPRHITPAAVQPFHDSTLSVERHEIVERDGVPTLIREPSAPLPGHPRTADQPAR